MTPQLDRLIVEIGAVPRRAQALAGGLDDWHWRTRPAPAGWSVGECLDHISLTVDLVLPSIRQSIEAGRRQGVLGPGPFRPGLVGGLLAWSQEPPYRMKAKTITPATPGSTRPKAEVLARLDTVHQDVVSCIRDADGLDLARLRVVSPFSVRVKYNVFAAFRILAAHGRRHLWQAEQVLRQLGPR